MNIRFQARYLERLKGTRRLLSYRVVLVVGLFFASFVGAGVAQAESDFGVELAIGTWRQDLTGQVSTFDALGAPGANVNFNSDLGLIEDDNLIMYANLDHPKRHFPNVLIAYSRLNVVGANQLDQQIDFEGAAFNLDEEIDSEIKWQQADVIFYYELWERGVSFDLGIGARLLQGSIVVATADTTSPTARSEKAEFDGAAPMVYTAMRTRLGDTGFWLAARVNGLVFEGDQLIDAQAHLGWQSRYGLGLELGYRTFDLTLEDRGDFNNAELEISGPFAALNFHF